MRIQLNKSLRASARVLVVGGLAVAVACGDLLDVKNPNAIDENALNNPAAAANIANGALAATTRMLSGTTVPYAVATDELDWIGSRDAWNDMERGIYSNYLNEFTDGAFPFVGEARYMADNAITLLLDFNTKGTLTNRADLARSYLYGAVVYASIADMYDDYAFSDKTISKAPIGRANMSRLYDTAVVYLDRAYTLATAAGAPAALTSLQYPIMAYRARVKHAKAVWQKITPKGATAPASPLVNDAGAVADANTALGLASSANASFTLVNNIEATAGINIWFEVNGRNEHRTGSYYRTLNDPVTGALDPTSQAQLAAFTAFGTQSGTFTLTSNRELRLILAEASLATGAAGQAAAVSQINQVRALDSKPAYTSGTLAQDQAMLVHERSVNLWLMRRRLADMHRFGIKDAKWVNVSGYESAFSVVGLLFPIPNVERLGNECFQTPMPAGC
jgi:starch-binding outer membrane protein, SusD/RagB family